MTDQRIESALDGHAWPGMPDDAHARLRRTLHALAAGLLLGALVGGGVGYQLAPRIHAIQPGTPGLSGSPVPFNPPDGPTEPETKRIVINASVFSDTRPALVRRTDPSAWSALPAD